MTSATDNLGPHLLGRIPSPPDARDYRLEDYLAAPSNAQIQAMLDTAVAHLKATTVGYANHSAAWQARTTTEWYQGLAGIAQARAALGGPLPPPAPSGDVKWADNDPVLDQGQQRTCHPPETLIRMADGSSKPITDVRPFDQVVTAEGNTKTVTALLGFSYSGDMFEIKLQGNRVGVQATPEHPILTSTGYVKAGEVGPGMLVACPKRTSRTAATALNVASVVPRERWQTTTRQYPNGRHGTMTVVAISAPPETLELDHDFGFLLGLYAAEGCKSKATKLQFCFGVHERETLVARCCDLIRSKLGAEPRIQDRPNNSVFVNVDGRHWVELFTALVGAGVAEKRLNIDGPEDFSRGLLEGWAAGDGHARRGMESGVTVSRRWALDMYGIAQDLGYQPTLTTTEGKSTETIKRRRRYDVTWRTNPTTQNAGPTVIAGQVFRRVKEIVRTTYAGPVFNLEVDGDHSFVANGIGSHNCVGHGTAQWGNTLPIDDHFTHQDALDLYYQATVFDGQPDDPRAPGGGQQGASVRSGMKALQQKGRLNAYASTTDVATIRAWVTTKGPVVIGSNWTQDMFNPDAQGYVHPTGAVAGGHCYTIIGDLVSESAAWLINSWGAGWALSGYFKMKWADVQALMNQNGEAWTAVELP